MSLYSTKLDQLYRFIAGKIILSRNLCRFIKGYRIIGAKNFFLVSSIVSTVTKILANNIVSIYMFFFSKILYLYRFKRYIFEYRYPPLVVAINSRDADTSDTSTSKDAEIHKKSSRLRICLRR